MSLFVVFTFTSGTGCNGGVICYNSAVYGAFGVSVIV
jgi:hypothetical protein